MATLIVLLPPHAATASTDYPWLLTSDGVTLSDHGSAPAALLPRPTGAGSEVVAVVAAAALSWHTVELPRGTSARSPRLRAILDGLLEERLLDDTEALHLALEPEPQAGAPVWVAACDRTWLRQQLQALEAAQRPVSRIVPELLPGGPDSRIYALGDAQQAQLALANADGVMLMPLTAAALTLLPVQDPPSPVLAEPAVAALAEQLLQTKVTLEQAPQRWLRAAQSGWDLAQLELATSGRTRALRRLAGTVADLLRAPQWRPARWGAALLIAVQLLGLNAWAWKERQALEGKREAIRNTLTQTFPNTKVVVDAPVQMTREVAALRQATGASASHDLETMLGALAAAAPTERTLSTVEYTAGELRAGGLNLSTDEAKALNSSLQAQGYAGQTDASTLTIKTRGQP